MQFVSVYSTQSDHWAYVTIINLIVISPSLTTLHHTCIAIQADTFISHWSKLEDNFVRNADDREDSDQPLITTSLFYRDCQISTLQCLPKDVLLTSQLIISA